MRQVTVAAWSEEVGISRQAAYRAVERCGIPVIDGKLDADAATILYRSRTRTRSNERRATAPATNDAGLQAPPTDSGADYWVSRARREKAEAEKSELEAAKLRGELAPVGQLEARYAKTLAAIREGARQVAGRLAPVVAAESDMRKCHELIEREMESLLNQAAGV